MFFVLSKLLNVLFSPLMWVVILVVISFLLRKKLRGQFQILAFILLLVFSNSFIFNVVSGLWDVNPVKAETLNRKHRTAVVLGGMATENVYNELPRFAQSADRLWQGLWLLKTGRVDTMVFTGGLGNLFDQQKPEGQLLEEYMVDVELMDERIIIESSSRNTYENARNTAHWFEKQMREKNIVLVTSTFHVRRARACFVKQGFEVEVFPADPLSSIRPLQWKDYIVPSGEILTRWGILFREWVGFVMYKLNGYI